jgi:hypothetical protein
MWSESAAADYALSQTKHSKVLNNYIQQMNYGDQNVWQLDHKIDFY